MKKKSNTSVLSAIVLGLKDGSASVNMTSASTGRALTLGQENLDSVAKASGETFVLSIESLVGNALSNVKDMDLSPAQRSAAQHIAKIAAVAPGEKVNLNGYLSHLSGFDKSDSVLGFESMNASDLMDIDTYALSAEAFDGQQTENALYYSVAYNVMASKQDEFAEAFYPTVTVDPLSQGILLEISYSNVYKEYTHSINGKAVGTKMEKTPFIKAMFDRNVMVGDTNKLVPVKRAETASLFVSGMDRVDDSAGTDITTAPLKFGEELSILAVSQTDATLGKGAFDTTDAVDRGASIKSVSFQFVKGATTETFNYDLSRYSGRAFQSVPQAGNQHFKQQMLYFNTSSIILDTTTSKTAAKAVSAILTNIGHANYKLKFKLEINGSMHLDTGDMKLNVAEFKLVGILDEEGVAVALDSAVGIAIVAAIGTITATGYEIDAFRTNSNVRSKGMLLTSDKYTQAVSVAMRSGVSVILPPVNAMGIQNDLEKVAEHITAVHAKLSFYAIEELITHGEMLRLMTSNKFDTGVKLETIAKDLIAPYYDEYTMDLLNNVDSLKSSERLEDTQAAVSLKIRDMVLKAYVRSGYNIAFKNRYGLTGTKPAIVVGTDPITASWLTSNEGKIDLGQDFGDVTIVSTNNPIMRGKIYVTFVIRDGSENTQVNELNFGNCLWSPTILTDFQKTGTGGQIVRELHNAPRFRHLSVLPILMKVEINDFSAVFGKNVHYMHTV